MTSLLLNYVAILWIQFLIYGPWRDPRIPGDGTVAYCDDLATTGGCQVSYDKEWITAGPRPSGVSPTCFTPFSHAVKTCNEDWIGTDRLYVTYSLFSDAGGAEIYLQYSDDQARSWSAPQFIAGSGDFCSPSWSPSRRRPRRPGRGRVP